MFHLFCKYVMSPLQEKVFLKATLVVIYLEAVRWNICDLPLEIYSTVDS